MQSELVEKLRRESLHIFPSPFRDGHAYHSTSFLLDKAADRITALEAENARLREALLELVAGVEAYERNHGRCPTLRLSNAARRGRAALQQPPTIDSLAAKVKRAAEQGGGRPNLGAMSADERDAALFQHNGDEG